MKSTLVYVYLFQDGYSKGHLQDKTTQEISKAMYCVKSVQGCVMLLLIDPNGIHAKL